MAPKPALGWEIIDRKGHWQRLHVEPYSDGEQRQWPAKPYRPSSEERYLISLAKAWAQKLGVEQPGVEYYLDKLPDGYALFELPQLKAGHIYKRLFGHPSGKYYDSTLRFQPHFLWLMSGMEGDCACIHCGNFKREGPIKHRTRHPAEKKSLGAREKRKSQLLYDSDNSSRSNSIAGPNATGTSTRPQRQVRTAGAPYAQDEEGTEDVYKLQLKTLEAHRESKKGIEDDIREPNSIDWRAEHSWPPPNPQDWFGVDLLQQSLTAIEHQHSFVPRVGELVLFCPTFLDQHYLMLDERTQEYKFYSFKQKCFHGFPTWRAGVIAAIPSATAADGPVDFTDIQDIPKKSNSLNTGGFRVETFPDPNNEQDKTASKQYKYLPLRNIRPLSHWHLLLRGIPRTKWHPSIEHALTCMTSISLLEKFYFKGDWEKDKTGTKKPQASIRCKGVYIGAELITIGDTVRILPETKEVACTDVLVVESIRLHLRDITPDHFLPDSPLLSTQSYITLVGKAYTTDRNRYFQKNPHAQAPAPAIKISPEEVKTTFRPVGSPLYGPWYALHAPQNRYEISHDQILGRLYEGAAVQLWTGLLQRKPTNGEKYIKPVLDYDLQGIQEGRVYATHADERLNESHEEPLVWFWADTRAEALDLQSINGVEVGRYDKVRDKDTLELWKTHLRILNGQQISIDNISKSFTNFDSLDSILGLKKRGRKAGARVINNKVYYPGDAGYDDPDQEGESAVQLTPSKHKGSQMAGAALVSTEEEDSDEEAFMEAQEDWDLPVEARSESPAPVRPALLMPKPKRMKTKAEIMASAADEQSFSDDDDELFAPLPIRGGTEETEGGDYDPGVDDD
ncbi:hypothetical protein G647_05719 [Cladophialophora carrionii CBS 160.54]|uniref:Cryptic loci regulator 2 N-terminal domain-containing protein n=1 Tax=Cladophialophora carrionii CBS 160.54 TaxID=1279043 RepID=V9DD96_9EURO|nr:uncharacterized protein G647_05719 [Cladophialophora carrionii CBS 160.54]ETI23912.1 hypothetical protein G647_05719 [Cladophialophora carrionii CBS 160.54]